MWCIAQLIIYFVLLYTILYLSLKVTIMGQNGSGVSRYIVSFVFLWLFEDAYDGLEVHAHILCLFFFSSIEKYDYQTVK